MKKITAILLALILMLSLSTTAMAETGDTAVGANNEGTSSVNFRTESTQISATVPLTIVASVNWGTGAITFPTDAKIVNTSVFKIHVESIICEAATGWTLAETAGALPDTIVATVKTDVADVDPVQTAIPLLATSKSTANAYWDMDAKDGAHDELVLTFAGDVKNAGEKTTALTTGAEGVQAFTIKFTVAAGANT